MSVSEYLESKNYSTQSLKLVTEGMFNAVKVIHDSGIIHRNIKP